MAKDPDDKKKKNGNGDGDGNDPKGQQKQVTMTQDALDTLFTERADRAKNSAISGLLSDVGVEDVDGLKAALTDWNKIKDEQKTELEKIQGDLDTSTAKTEGLETELEEAKGRARTYMLRSSIISAARDADFLKESLEDVWLLISTTEDLFSKLSVEEDQVKGADALVKEVAKLRPHWIEQTQRPGTPAPRGVGGAVPKKREAEEEAEGPLVRF